MTHTRARAGMVLFALALVGGTGCITANAVANLRQEARQRELAEARARRIATLEPAVQAGDTAAMVAQAEQVLTGGGTAQELARAIGLLSRAAYLEHPPAQALLGEMLARGQTRVGAFQHLPRELADEERGITLLKKAAAHACQYGPGREGPGPRWLIMPAGILPSVYRHKGNRRAARLWEAREVMHCGVPAVKELVARMGYPGWADRRVETMALLLLTEDQPGIAAGAATLAAEQLAAARNEAAELRRRVLESEDEYPAPPRKEWQ